jgi:hypothetical protein
MTGTVRSYPPTGCPQAPTGTGPGVCPARWQTDINKSVVTQDLPVVIKMHRCAFVGEHSGHQCPCGSMLVTAPVAALEDLFGSEG